MENTKRIGLVAHDARKGELRDWVSVHRDRLARHSLWATGTTGRLVAEATGLDVTVFKSGPLGGDQQMGALIAEGGLDVLIFFVDPMTSMPHDVDVKALVRLCGVYDTVLACNRSSADFVITSPLFDQEYLRKPVDYADYLARRLPEMDT